MNGKLIIWKSDLSTCRDDRKCTVGSIYRSFTEINYFAVRLGFHATSRQCLTFIFVYRSWTLLSFSIYLYSTLRFPRAQNVHFEMRLCVLSLDLFIRSYKLRVKDSHNWCRSCVYPLEFEGAPFEGCEK